MNSTSQISPNAPIRFGTGENSVAVELQSDAIDVIILYLKMMALLPGYKQQSYTLEEIVSLISVLRIGNAEKVPDGSNPPSTKSAPFDSTLMSCGDTSITKNYVQEAEPLNWEDGYYTTADVMKILGISRTKLNSMIKDNEFRVMRIGKNYRIPKKNFDTWFSTR